MITIRRSAAEEERASVAETIRSMLLESELSADDLRFMTVIVTMAIATRPARLFEQLRTTAVKKDLDCRIRDARFTSAEELLSPSPGTAADAVVPAAAETAKASPLAELPGIPAEGIADAGRPHSQADSYPESHSIPRQ